MNRIEKMNEIRNHCGIKPAKRSFFYRDEIVAIVENTIDRELSDAEVEMSVKQMIVEFMPNWKTQNTAQNHPSVENLNYILSLMENKGVEAQDVPDVTHRIECLAPSKEDRVVGLAEFILRCINSNFDSNILSVSVSADNPKEFTVILK